MTNSFDPVHQLLSALFFEDFGQAEIRRIKELLGKPKSLARSATIATLKSMIQRPDLQSSILPILRNTDLKTFTTIMSSANPHLGRYLFTHSLTTTMMLKFSIGVDNYSLVDGNMTIIREAFNQTKLSLQQFIALIEISFEKNVFSIVLHVSNTIKRRHREQIVRAVQAVPTRKNQFRMTSIDKSSDRIEIFFDRNPTNSNDVPQAFLHMAIPNAMHF